MFKPYPQMPAVIAPGYQSCSTHGLPYINPGYYTPEFTFLTFAGATTAPYRLPSAQEIWLQQRGIGPLIYQCLVYRCRYIWYAHTFQFTESDIPNLPRTYIEYTTKKYAPWNLTAQQQIDDITTENPTPARWQRLIHGVQFPHEAGNNYESIWFDYDHGYEVTDEPHQVGDHYEATVKFYDFSRYDGVYTFDTTQPQPKAPSLLPLLAPLLLPLLMLPWAAPVLVSAAGLLGNTGNSSTNPNAGRRRKS